MKTITNLFVALGVLLPTGLASAQELAPWIAGRPGEENIVSKVGISVQAGGGVTNFSTKEARDTTKLGGSWEARVVAGTRSVVALEGAYVGTARGLTTSGISSDATLMSHGAEAALRLNLPILVSRTLIEPFAFGGVGWARYSLTNEGTNTSSVASVDDIGTIPFGAGLAVSYRQFVADARFTYRGAFSDETLIGLASGGHASLQSWNVGVQLGYEF